MNEFRSSPWTAKLVVFLSGAGLIAFCVEIASSGEEDYRLGGLPAGSNRADVRTTSIANDTTEVVQCAVDQAHAACFDNDPFPSAKKCQKCHPVQFREWSVSPHSYAQLSPVFNAMSNTLIHVTNGTQGDFCIRCHTPVGMAIEEPVNLSNLNRHPTSREGVTCVVCHRINQAWGKGAGRLALVSGDVHQVVYGPIGNEILTDVLSNPDTYGVMKTEPSPNVRGNKIHSDAIGFFAQTTSGFCGACHDVFAPNGFRLEDAFSEFKTSKAALKEYVSCQDCHMGRIPGVASGYDEGPAAILGNVSTRPRKRTNHMIAGPDYSIIHAGLFPHNVEAIREENAKPEDRGLATMREWLQFDDDGGWGIDAFETSLPEGHKFPAVWRDATRRYQARRIINDQHALLKEAARQRYQVLRNGYGMDEIVIDRADFRGIRFRVNVYNRTNGHGVPTGFDAERVVYLRVLVWDSNDQVVFQSGDLDPNGDLRDSHSVYVHNGKLPLDRSLVSLQTKFIIRNVRGGEREQVLVFPFSPDPLPYVRPETRPFTVLGRPVAARKHKQNIEPGGHRWAKYEIKRSQLTGCGPYHVKVQLIAGMVPVNLVHAISSVGFDYGMSAKQIADNVVKQHMVLYEDSGVIHLHE